MQPHRTGSSSSGRKYSVVHILFGWILVGVADQLLSSPNHAFTRNTMNANTGTSLSLQQEQPVTDPSRSVTTPSTKHPYCSAATQLFPLADLDEAVERALDFHSRGGNIKSIQTLLDDNIDATVQKLGVQFVPKQTPTNNSNASNNPTQKVTAHLANYYAHHPDARGGYGQPLPGQYTPKHHPLILEDRYVEVAEPVLSRARWDAALGPLGPACPQLVQIGDRNRDGTKWMCAQAQATNETSSTSRSTPRALRKQQQQPSPAAASTTKSGDMQDECHILSIGGNDNWHFEEQFLQTPNMQDCITHTFDCTLPGGIPLKKPNNPNIRFYNYCLDDHAHVDTSGHAYVTYFDMLQLANITNAAPRLFKLDVEGFEYDVLSHMITTNQKQRPTGKSSSSSSVSLLPQQIVVELHWATRMTALKWMPRTRQASELALFSSMLFTGGGYMPLFQSWSKYCPSCIEVLYYKTLCY